MGSHQLPDPHERHRSDTVVRLGIHIAVPRRTQRTLGIHAFLLASGTLAKSPWRAMAFGAPGSVIFQDDATRESVRKLS